VRGKFRIDRSLRHVSPPIDNLEQPMMNAIDTNEILEAVRELAPSVAARSDEIERGRRVPADLVDTLTAAGCFRMLVPRSHGGAELDFTAQMRVIAELAQADASVAWTTMIGGAAPVILGLLPRPVFDMVYADGPDVIVGGAFNPTGVATPVDGGYRVSGQWSFASGCQHCHWFVAHCFVDDGRVPPVRMMVLPPTDVEIKDTWSVSGLCGTGSHDFVVNDVFVPTEWSFSLFKDASCLESPLGRVPELSFSALEFANVAVGIAQGALDDIVTLASGKVPMLADGTLASNALFQHHLGEADTRLRASRTLLYADAEDAWSTARTGVPFTLQQRARMRATATWATNAAASVVDIAYAAGGGTSIYSSSPLQRRLRDIRALTQHFAIKPDTLTKAGAVLAGQEVDVTML
jgi:alkylation response protein AidB-like acyl-CoA dehydrogenase